MAPVELLQQDDPRELVRKRERAEGEAMVDALELEPERPADHEAEIRRRSGAAPPGSALKATESMASPSRCSSDVKLRPGTLRDAWSSSRTSISSSRV